MDADIVRPIATLLRTTKALVFRDEDSIEPGAKWRSAIAASIARCDAMLVFWSQNSATSSAVAAEYSLALNARKSIVPVIMDETPLAPSLAEYQWIDLRDILKAIDQRTKGSSRSLGLADEAAKLYNRQLTRTVLRHLSTQFADRLTRSALDYISAF